MRMILFLSVLFSFVPEYLCASSFSYELKNLEIFTTKEEISEAKKLVEEAFLPLMQIKSLTFDLNVIIKFFDGKDLDAPESRHLQLATSRDDLLSKIPPNSFEEVVASNHSTLYFVLYVNRKIFSHHENFEGYHGSFPAMAKGLIIRYVIESALKHKSFYRQLEGAAPLLYWNRVAESYFPALLVAKEYISDKIKEKFPSTKKFFGSSIDYDFVRTLTNIDHRRSPDSVEFDSFESALAVHLEYYLMDPEYGARFPSLTTFFNQTKLFKAHESIPLESPIYNVVLSNEYDFLMNDYIERNIRPDRIYDIELGLAHRGEMLDTQEGHSVLRLIVCSPNRKTVGPECRNDYKYHIIISPYAFAEKINISTWKGIFGKYDGRIYLFDFLNTIRMYTEGGKRDVEFSPLHLDMNKKTLLIQKIIEMQHTYLFKYGFFKHNCSVAILNLLDIVVGEDDFFKKHFNVRPYLVMKIFNKYTEKKNNLREHEITMFRRKDQEIEAKDWPAIKRIWQQDVLASHLKTFADYRKLDFTTKMELIEKYPNSLTLILKLEQFIESEKRESLRLFLLKVYDELYENEIVDKELMDLVSEMNWIRETINYNSSEFDIVKGYGIILPQDNGNKKVMGTTQERLERIGELLTIMLEKIKELSPEAMSLVSEWQQAWKVVNEINEIYEQRHFPFEKIVR